MNNQRARVCYFHHSLAWSAVPGFSACACGPSSVHLSAPLIHSEVMMKGRITSPVGRRFHAPVTCNLQSAICNLQSATCTWSCPCFSLSRCVPYHTYSKNLCRAVRLHISQQHCSCGGPCSTALVARRRGHTFLFFSCRDEKWYPDLARCDGSCRISSHLAISRPSPESSGIRPGRWGQGGGPRPGPHLAGPRAHFVMLTNPLTVQGPPAQKAAIYTPPGLAIC